MTNTICHEIVSYEGNDLYSPIKTNDGLWQDQCGQQIRKNHKLIIRCPCKQYSNENCNTNYKHNLIYQTNNINYFIQKHMHTAAHKAMLKHKNEHSSSLGEKSKNELVDRIEELEKNARKDKVDFRLYLEAQQKESCQALKHKDEALKHKDEVLKHKDELIEALKTEIEALKKKPDVPVGNLLD